MNRIEYLNQTFVESDIVAGGYILEHAKAGESLAFDALNFIVMSENPRVALGATLQTVDGEDFITSDNFNFEVLSSVPFTEFIHGTPVMFYQDYELIQKFYLKDVKRISKGKYRFECVSAIGMLNESNHPGGIYNGALITNVLDEIFGGIPYELDPIAQNIKLYGWLPYAKKRDNLQQITIATALSVVAKEDGTPYLTALSSNVKSTFNADRLVLGASVEAGSPCTVLQVTEHQFLESDEEIILCNESFVTTKIILFSEPVHDLVISGGTIIESSANHATVTGEGNVLLTGKRYIHNQKVISIGDSDKKVLQIKDATLITSLNSYAVAAKLFEAYNKATTIKAPVIRNNEKPGQVIEILNPHTERLEQGFLYKMASDITKSPLTNIEVLMDYTPSGVITGYKNRVIISQGESWTVPAGVTEIRAIVIGGGSGGQAGYKGQNGNRGGETPQMSSQPEGDSPWYFSFNGDAGDGGEGGLPGSGGKVLDTGPLSVTPGQSFAVSMGSGGTGGSANGAPGSPGEDTEFGDYSSESGDILETGYIDIMTSEVFAPAGYPGFKGQMGIGKNNIPPVRFTDDISKTYQGDGFTTRTRYTGIFEGYGWYSYWWSSPRKWSFAAAGGGGGSSYNNHGGDGTGAEYDYNNGKLFLDGGNGGNGAAGGTSKNATAYGGGGFGGHGGGGGGGGGGASNHLSGDNYYLEGAGGQGGNGGAGGNGKQGCIIVYY